MNGSNCQQIMDVINQASFAVDDLLLYLDTHPCDAAALNYYHHMAQMRKEAMEAYQSQCGQLMADQTRSDSRFLWVEGPWPWEGGIQ